MKVIMKTWNEYLESVVQTKRQGITHLDQMKPIEFIEFAKSIITQNEGVLRNIKATLKVDGFGARIGKDKEGKFFFESSRSGPIQTKGAFSAFHKAKGTTDEIILHRASQYDRLYDELESAKFMNAIPTNTKVVVECLYNPLAVDHGDQIKFASVKYDRSKVGSHMTLVLIDIITADGLPHPKKDKIWNELIKQSTQEIKITDAKLKAADLDISAIIDPLATLDNTVKEILQSRKAVDRDSKKSYNDFIQTIQEKLASFILQHPDIVGKTKFGDEIEGLVLDINGKLFKITTPAFRAGKRAEASQRKK